MDIHTHSLSASDKTANPILDECRQIDTELNLIQEYFDELRILHRRHLNDIEPDQHSRVYEDLASLNSNIQSSCQALASRIKSLVQHAPSRNPINASQVDKVTRRLNSTVQEYRQIDNEFNKNVQAQAIRQYQVVQPEATDAEVLGMLGESPNHKIFRQALLDSSRQGHSRQVLRAVEDRHFAIQHIESQLEQIAQLFEDMSTGVVQQDNAIAKAESITEDTQVQLERGGAHLDGAIGSARSHNRWKWWCLGKCPVTVAQSKLITTVGAIALFIVILVVVVLIMTQVVKK
jgi:syntaxin 1B/2/3